MIGHEESIIKKIEIEQKFSDVVFKQFRSERFGITYCCPLNVDKLTVQKELCDWQELRSPVYLTKKYKEETWIHGGGTILPSWGVKDCGTALGTGLCIDLDTTCLYIEVVNQNGDPIEDYPIYIDGGNRGVTNADGILRTRILNASTQSSHILDLCYCFKTTGLCSQMKITITAEEECPKEPCEDVKLICEELPNPPLPPFCDQESGPILWNPNDLCVTTQQAFWFFTAVEIGGSTAVSGDWVAAYSPTTGALVGVIEVTTFPVTIPVYGDDGFPGCALEAMQPGEKPIFQLYKASTCEYCTGTPSQEEEWQNGAFRFVDLLLCNLVV